MLDNSPSVVGLKLKCVIKYSIEHMLCQDKLPFMLHDFGFRGSTSVEAAGIGGAAHLVNFMGTDTLSGIITARQEYIQP